MRSHRRTAKTVPNNPPPDNTDPFDSADALESLHTEIVQLEAFAHAAGEAVTRLPHSSNPKHRRDLTRIHALVSKVATDTTAAGHHGDQLIAALSAHLEARRTSPTKTPSTVALPRTSS
jgi:hypothetical protein